MAEQAVLARRRPDGRYDISHSRWGGTNRALAGVVDGVDPAHLPGLEWERRTRGVSFATLVAQLDYLSTAVCYRATTETTPFLALWFGLPFADESAARTAGALVSVSSLADARSLRVAFRTLKGTLTDALVGGDLPSPAAPLVLLAWLAGQRSREIHVSPPFQFPSES